MINIPLLPKFTKYIGYLLMTLGSIGIYYFSFLSLKPDIFEFKTFTIYSKFLDTKTFTFIENNQGDEIAVLIYFIGFFLIFFSALKNETTETKAIRIKSLFYSTITTTILYVFSYLFTHGFAIIVISLISIFVIPLFYLLYFCFFYLKSNKKPSN